MCDFSGVDGGPMLMMIEDCRLHTNHRHQYSNADDLTMLLATKKTSTMFTAGQLQRSNSFELISTDDANDYQVQDQIQQSDDDDDDDDNDNDWQTFGEHFDVITSSLELIMENYCQDEIADGYLSPFLQGLYIDLI